MNTDIIKIDAINEYQLEFMNGDLYATKKIKIENIEKYELNIIENVLILKPKLINNNNDNDNEDTHEDTEPINPRQLERIEQYNILKRDFTFSKISDCYIDGVQTNATTWLGFLRKIYEYIDDTEHIFNFTLLTIKKEEYNERGFKYYSNLKLSIRGEEAKKIGEELFNMVFLNRIKIKMRIEFKSGDIINYEN